MDGCFGDYTDALCREIVQKAGSLRIKRWILVFFGGGTPSVLPPGCITKIVNALSDNFDISENAEISIEVNPGTISREKAAVYRSLVSTASA